jgi:FdhE protein
VTNVNGSLAKIIEQLRLARRSLPEWAEVLDLQIDVLVAQQGVVTGEVDVQLTAVEATERRRQGLPLVTGRELRLDWDAFAALYRRLCQIAATHRSDLAPAFGEFEEMAEREPDVLRSWVAHLMVESRLGEEIDPEGLRTFVLTHTLRPFLRAYAAAYGPLVDLNAWRRGYCPICAGEPDFAALMAEDGGPRHLLCSRCDFEWQYVRLGCPFCETREPSNLNYYLEEDGSHRLYVCDHCGRYLKAIDLRGAPGRVLLPVERVLTVPMDVAAREQGYQ